MAYVQLVRPGAPVVFRPVRVSRCRCRPARRRSARPSRRSCSTSMAPPRAAPGRAVPLRRIALRVEAAATPRPRTSRRTRCSRRSSPASTSCSTRPAGSRAGSPSATRSSSPRRTTSCGMVARLRQAASTCRANGQALGRDPRRTGPGTHFSGRRTRSPTSRPRSTARRRPTTTSYEQWLEEGGLEGRRGMRANRQDLKQRARRVRAAAASTPGIDEALTGVRHPPQGRCLTRSADLCRVQRPVHRAGLPRAAGRCDRPGRISEVARQAELPTSTVARLLGTLEGLGAVIAPATA